MYYMVTSRVVVSVLNPWSRYHYAPLAIPLTHNLDEVKVNGGHASLFFLFFFFHFGA